MGRLLRRTRKRDDDLHERFVVSETAAGRSMSYPDVTITWPPAADSPPRPARHATRLIAPAAAAALVAATTVVITVLGQGGLHARSRPSAPLLAPAPPPPALVINVVRAGCDIFVVKNVSDYIVLQARDKPVPTGATLPFNEVPLDVQISSPACADVYVHGRRQRDGSGGSPWTFAVPR